MKTTRKGMDIGDFKNYLAVLYSTNDIFHEEKTTLSKVPEIMDKLKKTHSSIFDEILSQKWMESAECSFWGDAFTLCDLFATSYDVYLKVHDIDSMAVWFIQHKKWEDYLAETVIKYR